MAPTHTSGKRRIGLIILILLILGAAALVILNPFKDLASFVPGLNTPASNEEVGDGAVPVRISRVQVQDLRDYIRLNGDVVDTKTIDVYPEVTGKITFLDVEVGDRVVREQEIARIDPSRPGMVYRETAVKSPAEGTVLAVNFPLGASVSPQAPLVRLGMLGNLEVEVSIAERHIGKVGIGSEAMATFAAYPGRTFSGTVVRLAPVLNPATRTLKVGIAIEDPQHLVKAGMFPSLLLFTDEVRDARVVDRTSIMYDGGQTYVFTLADDQRARRTPVTVGLVVGDTAQILEGLQEDDDVVVQGQSLLADGAAVTVVE